MAVTVRYEGAVSSHSREVDGRSCFSRDHAGRGRLHILNAEDAVLFFRHQCHSYSYSYSYSYSQSQVLYPLTPVGRSDAKARQGRAS